jgi:hypothetical protein
MRWAIITLLILFLAIGTQILAAESRSADIESDDVVKEYISHAGGYLHILNKQGLKLAQVMIKFGTGEATLGDVKKAIKDVRFVEGYAWRGDYLDQGKLIVPASLFTLNAKIKRCHQLHVAAWNEMLEYWRDNNIVHLESGIATGKVAAALANECLADLTVVMESMLDK